jgi:hypothetical protein
MGRNAWLATQCRSHRSPAKFPANREFYRENHDFRPLTASVEQETAVPQGLFEQFPKQTIREFFLKNREF